MFVRTLLKKMTRFVDVPQALREMHIPASRLDDNLGLCGPDFSAMAHGGDDTR